MGKLLSTIIIYPLTQIIEFSYVFFYRFFGNAGISVIGVSLAVTLLCLPLYIVAERWQQVQRDTEAKLNPRADRIKKAFKGDEQYMMLNTYYKQNHYHPLMALRSSFGLLIQIPFFIAAYSFLSNMPDLQGQSFLFIKDMGKPDALFKIGNFSVNILPIAMTLINIVAGAIYTKGFAVKEKVQIYGMALVFLVLLYTSPAGLVLYWTMNNVFSLVKNVFYKLKNPLKVLYIILCVCVVMMDIYMLFFFRKLARINHLKALSVVAFTSLLFIPLVVKFIKWFISNVLNLVVENKKLRFSLFIFSAAGCALLIGFVLPSLLISSSVAEFSDLAGFGCPSEFVWNTFAQCIGLFVFWPICIYFLFGKRIQTLITFVINCFLICGLINAFVFPGEYGVLTQWLVFDSMLTYDSAKVILCNLAVLFVAILLIICVEKYFAKYFSTFCCAVVIALSVISIVNIFKINNGYKDFKNNAAALESADEISKEFTFSKKGNNVLVIMLDRAISTYIPAIFEETPSLKEYYDGFVFYPNTLCFNGNTLLGSTPMLGGYEYTPDKRMLRTDKNQKEIHNEALVLIPTILSEQKNYEVTLADLPFANWSIFRDMSFVKDMKGFTGKNIMTKYNTYWAMQHPEYSGNAELMAKVLKRDFFWVSLFRASPSALRPILYFGERWWNSEYINKKYPYPGPYPELDLIDEMTEVIDDDVNHFIFFNSELPHDAYDFDAPNYTPSVNGNVIPSNSPMAFHKSYGSTAATFHRLSDLFKLLKDNDAYDNTRIIIVADHGAGEWEEPAPDEGYDKPLLENCNSTHNHKNSYNALLMVKDFNAKGEMKTDNIFMTNADVPCLALAGIVENPVNPFTNKKLDTSEKENGLFINTKVIWNSDEVPDLKKFPFTDDDWYFVKDNIYDSNNWTKKHP